MPICLKTQPVPPIPEQTKQVVDAVFSRGNRGLRIRQVFDGIFKDDEFETYYPLQGQLAYSPWRLALVSVLHTAIHGEFNGSSSSKHGTCPD